MRAETRHPRSTPWLTAKDALETLARYSAGDSVRPTPATDVSGACVRGRVECRHSSCPRVTYTVTGIRTVGIPPPGTTLSLDVLRPKLLRTTHPAPRHRIVRAAPPKSGFYRAFQTLSARLYDRRTTSVVLCVTNEDLGSSSGPNQRRPTQVPDTFRPTSLVASCAGH